MIDIYQLAAITGILGFLFLIAKPSWKIIKAMYTRLIKRMREIKSIYDYRNRVRNRKINPLDYSQIKDKVENDTASNLERYAYFKYRDEHPITKITLPDDFFEQMGKDFIERQTIKNIPPDFQKYLKK